MASNFIEGQLTEINNLIELTFRKNIYAIVFMIFLANGYSTIPGVDRLLSKIFNNYILRILITFILVFQITDDYSSSFLVTVILNVILMIIEKYEKTKNHSNLPI